MRRNKIMSEGQCSTHEKKRNKFRCPRNARFRAFYDFAAAHRRCVVCISARVLLVVPVPVPVPVLVPVVLLAPLVCDSTNRAENTPPSYTGPSKNIRRTPTNEPRTKFHLIERIFLGALLFCCGEGIRGDTEINSQIDQSERAILLVC